MKSHWKASTYLLHSPTAFLDARIGSLVQLILAIDIWYYEVVSLTYRHKLESMEHCSSSSKQYWTRGIIEIAIIWLWHHSVVVLCFTLQLTLPLSLNDASLHHSRKGISKFNIPLFQTSKNKRSAKFVIAALQLTLPPSTNHTPPLLLQSPQSTHPHLASLQNTLFKFQPAYPTHHTISQTTPAKVRQPAPSTN